jgi:hypothetical protein
MQETSLRRQSSTRFPEYLFTHVHEPRPEHVLSHDLVTSTHLPCTQVLSAPQEVLEWALPLQEEELWRSSLLDRKTAAATQPLLSLPSTPTKPDRQGPQVFGTLTHASLDKLAQIGAWEQFTALKYALNIENAFVAELVSRTSASAWVTFTATSSEPLTTTAAEALEQLPVASETASAHRNA